MASDLLGLLFEGLCASTAATALVLLLRPLWRRSFGAGCAPLLWLIVPLAIVAVMLPAPVQIISGSVITDEAMSPPALIAAAAPTASSWLGPRPLLILWLLGSAVAVLGFVMQQHRFRRSLGALRDAGRGYRVAEHNAAGPAVLGILRPTIVVPADFDTRYNAEQRALILSHERSHLRRGDLLANALATTLRSLYWFNPLIHYAAARMRHDHELASDAAVLREFPHARRCYADALLNTQLAVPGLPVGCLWQSSHPLKERIQMFKQPAPSQWRRSCGIVVGLVIATGAACAAWAAQPAQVRLAADASAGTAPTPRPATHRVKLHIIADGETSTPILHIVEGQSFGIASGRWEADFVYRGVDASHGTIDSVIRRDAEQIVRKTVQFNYAEPFVLDAGEAGAQLHIDARVAALDVEPETAATEVSGYRILHPPRYPKPAIQAKQSGKVVLRVKVGSDGVPLDIVVATTTLPGVFDAASIEAARAWRFNPARAQGRATVGEVMVPICFSVEEDGDYCAADGKSKDAPVDAGA